jgi:hypothetical protein
MKDDTSLAEHAALEAQRRNSNVYAFRRLKWGTPRLRDTGGRVGISRGEKRILGLPDSAAGRLRPLHIVWLIAAFALVAGGIFAGMQ